MTDAVLLVEDEMFVALDIQDIVERAGFVVDGPYATVGEAVGALRRARPAYAILDVQLVDGEVFPAADLLREAGVPIIFHSGHADAPSLMARYPGSAVCGKPCAPRAIQDALTSFVVKNN